ncbi:unnamed protein product, partial [Nesidiocoris tenuis]
MIKLSLPNFTGDPKIVSIVREEWTSSNELRRVFVDRAGGATRTVRGGHLQTDAHGRESRAADTNTRPAEWGTLAAQCALQCRSSRAREQYVRSEGFWDCAIIRRKLTYLSEMDWSEDEISTLLVLYKKNDVLWNPANPNYFRREVKIEAWQNLAAQLNRSEEECRRKMSSLLSSYRRERGREKRANKKGGGYDDDELNGLDEDDEPFELYPIQTIEEGSGSEDESNTTSSRPTIQMVETNLQPAPKRARVEKSEENDEQLSRGESLLASAADLMKSTATALSRNRDTCEVKTFCDFLAAKMLTYSKKTSRSVQHAVFDVLVQADRGTFECDKLIERWTEPESVHEITKHVSLSTIPLCDVSEAVLQQHQNMSTIAAT